MKDLARIFRIATLLVGCFAQPVVEGLSQTSSPYIVVDQFGYLPDARKIAVIRDPVAGFDADESFAPGQTYAVMTIDGDKVYEGAPVRWNNGAQDPSSGDKAWHFDFSAVTQPGEYYILDMDKNQRSFPFRIGLSVYNEALKQATKTFFYQRAGFEKAEPFAEKSWTDAASHVGPLQDKNARLYNDRNNAATERDLHGGWYDAGDYNKYTSWTAQYVVEMMKAYLERPEAWTDDFNIPESGNGVPDLLDEARWGLDFLLRMQNGDGSTLCIVGLSHASPPSSAQGPSLYGPATASATQNTAAALAISARVFRMLGDDAYAAKLLEGAEKAWDWSEANPNVLFRNNDPSYGSQGLGAGQQEEDDYGRAMGRLAAACFLFDATGKAKYRDYFDAHYQQAQLFKYNYAYPFQGAVQDVLLYYTKIEGASPQTVSAIRNKYKETMNGADNFPAFYNKTDPYMAHLKDYTWGSNGVKARQGLMFFNMIDYGLDESKAADARNAAAGYIHYLHGTNPLNMVYLSNMYRYGGDNCVNEFYHTWFADGSPQWDRVGQSTYGPPPGFLTGGPNPSYDWDGCCPDGCGSAANNAQCMSESITPPKGQPPQKSYKDFNTSWPLNSWSVTENSGGYQTPYMRLLSKFVNMEYDCNDDPGGQAWIDHCGVCVGGNTGKEPSGDCAPVLGVGGLHEKIRVFPNPCGDYVAVAGLTRPPYRVQVIDQLGRELKSESMTAEGKLDMNDCPPGIYILRISSGREIILRKLAKK